MKTHLLTRPVLTLAALAAFASLSHAEPLDTIAADYKAKSETALAKVNKTLDTQAAEVAARLIRLGANAEAQQLAEQVKAKKAGEPVKAPVIEATLLFQQYDSARKSALQPVQDLLLARIDTTLRNTTDLAQVTALGNLRQQIEKGLAIDEAPAFNWVSNWDFHKKKEAPADGSVVFNNDGTAIFTSKTGNKTPGTWVMNKTGSGIEVTFPSDAWSVTARKSGVEVKGKTWQDMAYLQPKK